jgi:hypothetical protein
VSERLSDAADSAEPAPPRQAPGDGGPPRPADEQAPAEAGPVQSAPPAERRPARAALAGGPPPRSALSEKARAVPSGIRPRRTAADVAREAGGKSPTGSDHGAGTSRGKRDAAGSTKDRAARTPGPRRDRAATSDAVASAGDRAGRDPDRRGDDDTPAGQRAGSDSSSGRASGRDSGSGRATDRASGKDAEGGVERERPGGPWPMPDRSLMATVLGINPALAVGVAAALTAVGVGIDLWRVGTLSTVFTVCYLTGCVLATAWVRRSGVFWPMVAPPLLMAVAVPVVVLVAGTPRPGAGIAQRLLVIGAPLVNGFPMMAWTTGLVLALGLFRLVTQREHHGRGAARAGGRTSASPRRS